MGYIGGIYSIPAEFRTENIPWSPNIDDPAVIDTILDLKKFQELVCDGFIYIEHLKIYFACVPAVQVRAIERNLLYALKPVRTTWGTLSPPGETLELTHGGVLPF
jgi:hypothetical protein